MGKASIAITERVSRVKPASHDALPKEPPGVGYLKLALLLAMIFLPWAGIIYAVRVASTGP